MAVFRCKICGGSLDVNKGDSVAACEYCGIRQTLPRLDDERRGNLYDRANHFRRNNEFDKAMSIYEQILNEDRTDAEAYWSLVLCRYGIEYVEDPVSRRRLPTVNRAQFTSVFDDSNYKSALQYADGAQRELYETEAKVINEIQKGILAISQKETPFDVFICYKETDHNGRRSPDSVLANELYHQLVQEGFKVFFSRITLEDKLGSAYEPYIFAALNSAKVMVVLGTRAEYFNAVWVKNEWSRYLSLIKQGEKKILIPAYRDMDPYDLPEEFSHLQAQDMSRLGFMQDLIRGIKKIAQPDKQKQPMTEPLIAQATPNIAPLLERAFMFLEDGEWDRADEFCEQVLNQDPKNAQAYLGKLMVELRVHKREDLKNQPDPFDNSHHCQKVVRFGDDEMKNFINSVLSHIRTCKENARMEEIFRRATEMMDAALDESAFQAAAKLFESIAMYKNSEPLAIECTQRAETARKDSILMKAQSEMTGMDVSGHESALAKLLTISGWKNADELIDICRKRIEEISNKAEEEGLEKEEQDACLIKTKLKRMKWMLALVLILFIILVSFAVYSLIPEPDIPASGEGVRPFTGEVHFIYGGTIDVEEDTPSEETIPTLGVDLHTALHFLNGNTADTMITANVSNVIFALNEEYPQVVEEYKETLVDVEQDVSVYAYYVPNGSYYDVYMLANDDIYAPRDSSELFMDMVALISVDTDNLNVSRTEDMSMMFMNCSRLTTLDVSSWDTGKVTKMSHMFAGCIELRTLAVDEWDVSNVTMFNSMFSNQAHNEANMKIEGLNLSGWDTSSSINMGYMFYGCGRLTRLDLSGWNVENLETVSHMFADCNMLIEVLFNDWNTPALVSVDAMFNDCWALELVDVSMFDTSNVCEFSQMFDNCYSLQIIKGLDNFDTANGQDFSEMFKSCNSLRELDLSRFDTRWASAGYIAITGVENGIFRNMISGCTSLERITLGTKFSFDGNGTAIAEKGFSVPAAVNVPGWDGHWYNLSTGEAFEPNEIPEETAATYVAVKAV